MGNKPPFNRPAFIATGVAIVFTAFWTFFGAKITDWAINDVGVPFGNFLTGH